LWILRGRREFPGKAENCAHSALYIRERKKRSRLFLDRENENPDGKGELRGKSL